MEKKMKKVLSIVIPVFNEADIIERFYNRLEPVIRILPYEKEIWFVDDGSTDQTNLIIRQIVKREKGVGLIELSRNFGHQVALSAAFDFVRGDIVICMDGDGQHPPELIPKMVELYKQGYDIVLTQRIKHGDTFLKSWSSKIFYKLINFLGDTPILPGSADFRLMSRHVVEGLCRFKEYHRFLRGMINWMGYRSAVLTFEPMPRIAGKPKYTFRKMARFASDAIFSFSTKPLKISILLGILLILSSIVHISYTLFLFFSGRGAEILPGWTSLFFSILGIGGVQLLILGVIGQYIGMIFEQVKGRPLYLLRDEPLYPTVNFKETESNPDAR